MTRLVPCDPIAAKPFVLLQCKMLLKLPLILVLLRVHILPQHHQPEQHSDKSNQPKHYPANPRPEADGMPCESTVVDMHGRVPLRSWLVVNDGRGRVPLTCGLYTSTYRWLH